MIVELYGPPGAGKTTFALALAARLRERGNIAEVRLSYRPAERPADRNACTAIAKRKQNPVIQRVVRPVVEMLALVRHPVANSRHIMTGLHLIRLLRPAKFWSLIKELQYLSRLSHSWQLPFNFGHVVLFDQAFVQAVISLALLAGTDDDSLIASALDFAPRSDVLVRLDAPLELLETRLNNRKCLQGTIEHLFETDVKTNIASIARIDRVHNLLLAQGRVVLRASSLDKSSLDKSVDMVEENVMSKFKAELGGVA
jgi:thymidylate kinase